AVGADGNEGPVAPVLRIRRNELCHLGERRAVVERRGDDGIPLRTAREHECRIYRAVGRDGHCWIPGVVVRADRSWDRGGRVVVDAAVDGTRERDPPATHPG